MSNQSVNFIALDLGSSKIAALAAYVDKQGNAKIIKQHIQSSAGIRSSVVTNVSDAENTIMNSVYGLEKECRKNIKQVAISLSGKGTKSHYLTHKVKLPYQVVAKSDIKKLLQQAINNFKLDGCDVIHYFPIEFIIDDLHSVDNPVGMVGRVLSCKLHIITGNSSMIMNIANCFAKCQVSISNIVLGSYASGIACLSDDEKNLGSIIIDIGARTTSLGVFLSGKFIYSTHIALGGWNITSDIAKVFSLNFSIAEKLKVLYGTIFVPSDKSNLINLDDLDPDNQYNPELALSVSQLSAVIHPRVEEMLTTLKSQYDQLDIDHLIARRVVVTGGGSLLRGLREIIGDIFGKQVRIASPHAIPGLAEDHNPAMYSNVLGILRNQMSLNQKNHSLFTIHNDHVSWISKTIRWVKDNI